MKKVEASKTFQKQMVSFPKETQIFIKRKIRVFLEDEGLGDVKKLQPKQLGLYRLRAGNFRIIFEEIDSETIALLSIDSRDKIYRKI